VGRKGQELMMKRIEIATLCQLEIELAISEGISAHCLSVITTKMIYAKVESD